MATNANTIFIVVAYDISSNRRRFRLVKLLKKYGRRANYSVFECRIKKQNINRLKKEIRQIIDGREDSILYYPLCRSCIERRQSEGFRKIMKKKPENLII